MHIKFIDDFILDIFVNKEVLGQVNIKDNGCLEKYLKRMFRILKEKYNIIINGFYDITIYVDKYYGILFHLEKEDMDYYDYFKNQVDMKITIIDTEFIYKVEDIPKSIFNKVRIFIKNNNIYLKIIDDLTDAEMMDLLENSEIEYEKN